MGRDADDPRPLPTFFLAGYQKSASTWLHSCFRDHSEIYVPEADAIHFFTVHYHRGFDWYRKFYAGYAGEKQVGDLTPSYIRFRWCLERMAAFNPSARILVTLRNPIERAYSHYWHEKRKGGIAYRFEDVLGNNVDLFNAWIATGFYHRHLERLFEFYPRERVQIQIYDDLRRDAAAFCRSAFEFLEVDPTIRPAVLDRKVNEARFRPDLRDRVGNWLRGRPGDESEYDRGIPPEIRQQLVEIYAPTIEPLSRLLDRDLGFWLEDPE